MVRKDEEEESLMGRRCRKRERKENNGFRS